MHVRRFSGFIYNNENITFLRLSLILYSFKVCKTFKNAISLNLSILSYKIEKSVKNIAFNIVKPTEKLYPSFSSYEGLYFPIWISLTPSGAKILIEIYVNNLSIWNTIPFGSL